MNLRAGILTVLVLIISFASYGEGKEDVGLLSKFEENLESSLASYTNSFVGWLEEFNDEHLGRGDIGKFLHYNEIKPKFEETVKQSRAMKKMGMALLPLIFHVGATSTWMLITSLLAAKSVAIGIALLVFKIAVSSAKVASFFTALKGKHHDHEWTPHYEHHGHYRSFSEGHHPTYEHTPYYEHTPHHETAYHEQHETPYHKPSYVEAEPETIPGPWTPDTSYKTATYKRDTEPFTYTKKGEKH